MAELVESYVLNIPHKEGRWFPIKIYKYADMEFVMVGGHSGIGKSTFFGNDANKVMTCSRGRFAMWHMDVKSAGKIFNRPLPAVCVLQISHRLHLVKDKATLNFVIGHFEESDVSMAIINSEKDYHKKLGSIRNREIPESWVKVYHKLDVPKFDIEVYGWNWSEWLLQMAEKIL